MSTKKYAHAFDRYYASAHEPAMDYPRILNAIMDRKRIKQAGLASLLGVEQPSVSRWLKGSIPKTPHHNAIVNEAKALRIPLGTETVNDGQETPAEGEEQLFSSVQIVGYVGGGRPGVHFYSEGQGPFGEADMPPGGTPDLVAVKVVGNSMAGTADPGSLLYYRNRRDPPTPDLMGKLCVVELPDDSVLVKRLYPGRTDGRYDLHSENGDALLDQAVVWAAKVVFIALPE